jgi:hypothetical protein
MRKRLAACAPRSSRGPARHSVLLRPLPGDVTGRGAVFWQVRRLGCLHRPSPFVRHAPERWAPAPPSPRAPLKRAPLARLRVQALLLLALADPSERVALEAMRALFGAPYPRATSAAAMRAPPSVPGLTSGPPAGAPLAGPAK